MDRCDEIRKYNISCKKFAEDKQKLSATAARGYTIEKQVCGLGYMSFYDEKDMLEQIVYCKNGCWKVINDKTARDLEGELCITEDEESDSDSEEEEEEEKRKVKKRKLIIVK